ncbi:MAG: diheme cytochrome c [Gammaproteobacteria bacterium]|nr:diheme cytochrome c [Gammaproteobacteria bacterium]
MIIKAFIMMFAGGLVTLLTIPVVFSDEDRHELRQRSLGVAAVTSKTYTNECSSCHMLYPPGLLPARSWQKLMSSLDTHFDDNAELDSNDATVISAFLMNNSADKSTYRRSRKIMRSLNASDSPLRISELSYIKREHDEIPDKMIRYNKKVVSLSHCNACHADAEKGIFDEHRINIPGYGHWDD